MRSLKNFYHLILALFANIYYGFPSRKLKVVGVTGTDGKTTTTHLIYHILKSSGKKVSMISTVYAKIGNNDYPTGLHTTTPQSTSVQKYLHMAAKNNDEYFVLETTAHGLDQYRVWGIDYHISILTNITHEHLDSKGGYDYFKTYDNYLLSKSKLLLSSTISIINRDDMSYDKIKKILDENHKQYFTFGLKNKSQYQWDNDIQTGIAGEMNKYNIVGAMAVADRLGIKKSDIISAIKSFRLPTGRLDMVYDKDFKVIIDFAHTINGIVQILKTVKDEMKTDGGRIIHVFGAAGLRDQTKREKMGEASSSYADFVILTEEDCRTEDPREICREIARGLEKNKFVKTENLDGQSEKSYTIFTDRKKAVELALKIARKNDIVVITGKGHEKSLCRGKTEYPWDERKIITDALKAYTSL